MTQWYYHGITIVTTNSRMRRFRLDIRAKILLLALLIAWPPLLVVSYFGIVSLDQARDTAVSAAGGALRIQAEQQLAKRAQDKALVYNTTLVAAQQQLETAARYVGTALQSPPIPVNPVPRVFVPASSVANTDPLIIDYARQATPLLESTVRANPLLSLGYITFDAGGVTAFDHDIIDTISAIEGFDARTRPWYIAARQAGRTVWAEPYIDANTKQPVVTVATPIYDARGVFVGVAGFDMLLATVQADLLRLDMGPSSYAFLLNSQGSVVVRPEMQVSGTWNQPLVMQDLLATENSEQRAVIERMMQQERGVAQLTFRSDTVYISYAPILTSGWAVGIVVPAREVVAAATEIGTVIGTSQQQFRERITIAVAASLAAVVLLGALLSFLLARPLRRLADGAQRVAAGDLSSEIAGAGNDEVGDLVRAFNVMTVALREKVSELEDNLSKSALLNTTSNRFRTLFSLSQLFEAIPQAVRRDFGFDRSALYLLDGQRLRVVSADFGPDDAAQAAEFTSVANADPITLDSETIEADVIRSGQAVIIDQPWGHPRVPQAKQLIARSESYVIVPLFGPKERPIGILTADFKHARRPITARDAAHLLTFASMVGLTVENARLYKNLERQVAQRTTELRAALEKAREADRLKSQFLAAISHELRTPLNAIIGFSTVLLDELDGPLTTLQVEDVRTINQNGRFLLHMINELLDLARIESGKLEMKIEPVDVAAVIGEAVDTAQGLLYGKPVRLRTKIQPGLPHALADAAKLRQVVLNLLSNAVKFTEKGEITVIVGMTVMTPTHGTPERLVCVSVRDSGIGIAPDQLALVFEEFRQVHPGRTGRRGSGLGLAIVRRLLDAQGGRIWVESTQGEGSTFSFTIPTVERAAARVEHPADAELVHP